MQHVTSNNVGCRWPTILRPFARGFRNTVSTRKFNASLPEFSEGINLPPAKEVPLIFVRRNYGSLIRNTPSTGGFFQLTASAGEMLRGGRRRPKPRAAKPRSDARVTINE